MSTASIFANWTSLNRSNRIFGPDEIQNDAQRNGAYLTAIAMRAKGDKAIRSGTYIEERVRTTTQGNFRPYTPGETRTPSRRQTIQTIQYGWRFHENELPYTDAEIDLSQGDQLTVFKNFKKSLDDDLAIDHYEGIENLWFARVDSATQESVSVRPGKANSIPVFISEYSDFLPPGSTSGTGTTWGSTTTIGGLSVPNNTAWRNQQSSYVSTTPSSSTAGIFAAFDTMFLKVEFIQPEGYAQWYESTNLQAMRIITNTNGRAIYSGLCRDANDQFRGGPQDPSYGNPVYNGIPVMRNAQLDTELLNESAGAYTEAAYTNNKPRFFWVNFNHLFMVFHPMHFMEETDPINGGVAQRDTYTMFKVSWCNIVCNSRKRQGIVYPSDA